MKDNIDNIGNYLGQCMDMTLRIHACMSVGNQTNTRMVNLFSIATKYSLKYFCSHL